MLDTQILLQAYHYLFTAKTMADTFEANRQICKYVHATYPLALHSKQASFASSLRYFAFFRALQRNGEFPTL